jgi:hypothetical protein
MHITYRRSHRMVERVPRHLVGALLVSIVSLALIGCGDNSSPPAPNGPLAEALSEIGGGGDHGSLGVGWTEPQLARAAGVSPRLMATALGPNAESVLEAAPALRRRFGFDPLSADRLVSVGGSYAFGLRLEGVGGSGLRGSLMRAGGHPKQGDEDVGLLDVGSYAQVPAPLLRAGIFGLGARDAFSPSFTVLAISATSRADLLGHAGRLIDQPIYRAAADCLGKVVAARMVPERLLLSVEVGIELVAVGIQRDREVLCVLGGTADRSGEIAAALRRSLAPDARDPRTGERMSKLVGDVDVSAGSYDDVQVVRAELTPVGGPGFLFGTIARGSLIQLVNGQTAPAAR